MTGPNAPAESPGQGCPCHAELPGRGHGPHDAHQVRALETSGRTCEARGGKERALVVYSRLATPHENGEPAVEPFCDNASVARLRPTDGRRVRTPGR